MLKCKRATQLIAGAVLAGALCACAHIKKVDIPATANPADEISRTEASVNEGYNQQYDVLAAKEFRKARTYLDDAKKDIARGRSQERILNDLGYSRAYLDRAKNTAEGRQAKVQGILDARQAAIDQGARKYLNVHSRIGELDNRFRDIVDEKIDPDTFHRLQSDYMDLELGSIQQTQLNDAIAKVNGAKREGARKNTPNILRKAEFDIANAKNVIAANRHSPTNYEEAVDKANRSAELLVEVLAATKHSGKDLSEDVALDLVRQKRQIQGLESQLGRAEKAKTELSQEVTTREQALKQAQATENLDKALEQAREEFSKDEAEVYRQGDKLLIRLKAVNFPIGRSELPTDALPLLAKVKGIAEDLHPQNVTVEGHTDSTGGRKLNMKLSKNRAEAVAKYFESNGLEGSKIQAVGQGFQAPIADNKTKAGRAINRRVDVIITPAVTNSNTDKSSVPADKDSM